MNLDYFIEQQNTQAEKNENYSILETPFLECLEVEELNEMLSLYYSKNFEESIQIGTQALLSFEEDCGLYNFVGCALYNLKEYNYSLHFFNQACRIIYSYHAVYHFIGYTLHYNRATLHHIMGNFDLSSKDLSKAQFLYHQNNPNRDTPLQIDEENIHFKNPTKDMLPKQKAISHLSIFKNSKMEQDFWKSLQFFEKRQWNKCLNICNNLIEDISNIHLEYHYFAACMFYNRAMNHIAVLNKGEAIADLSKAISFDLRNPRNNFYKENLKKLQQSL